MAFNFTEFLKRSVCCFIRNPKREITYAWLFSLVLVLIAFIVACVSASRMNQAASDKAAAFTAVWTALLLIAISLIGTVIMRRYPTALAIGFLVGVIFIMTQQMLIVFAFFAEQAQDPTNSKDLTMSQEAMAVFAFFLFLIYASFGSMLAIFRLDVIKEEVLSQDANDFDVEPNEPAAEDDNQI